MAHMRDKEIYCPVCNGRSKVTANLDTGKITGIALASDCKFTGKCPKQFVEGIFDRPFGESVIRPKMGGNPFGA